MTFEAEPSYEGQTLGIWPDWASRDRPRRTDKPLSTAIGEAISAAQEFGYARAMALIAALAEEVREHGRPLSAHAKQHLQEIFGD